MFNLDKFEAYGDYALVMESATTASGLILATDEESPVKKGELLSVMWDEEEPQIPTGVQVLFNGGKCLEVPTPKEESFYLVKKADIFGPLQ